MTVVARSTDATIRDGGPGRPPPSPVPGSPLADLKDHWGTRQVRGEEEEGGERPGGGGITRRW